MGETRFFVENLLSQGAEKLRREPFCAEFQNFLLAKTFKEERGRAFRFSVEMFFYLIVPKISCGGNP